MTLETLKEKLARPARMTYAALLSMVQPSGPAFASGGYARPRARTFAGLKVMVENPVGSTRSGTKPDGAPWSTVMQNAYGYLARTRGADGEGLDVFLAGPCRCDGHKSEDAYVVHQNDPSTGRYDEDKVMLGFHDPEEAKAAYLANYDRPDFFRSMTIIPMDRFRQMLSGGEAGGVRWNRKHKRTHEAAALFAADDEGDSGRWVTIGARKDAPKGQKGGTPVMLGKGGTIQKGPAALTGKKIGDLKRHPLHDKRTGQTLGDIQAQQRSPIALAHERAQQVPGRGYTDEKNVAGLPQHPIPGATPDVPAAHEMTQQEYARHAIQEGHAKGANVAAEQHEAHVAQAIERGDEVPEHVLADYPHLEGEAMLAQHHRELEQRQAAEAEAAKMRAQGLEPTEDGGWQLPQTPADQLPKPAAKPAEALPALPAKPTADPPAAATPAVDKDKMHARVQELKAQGKSTALAVAQARKEQGAVPPPGPAKPERRQAAPQPLQTPQAPAESPATPAAKPMDSTARVLAKRKAAAEGQQTPAAQPEPSPVEQPAPVEKPTATSKPTPEKKAKAPTKADIQRQIVDAWKAQGGDTGVEDDKALAPYVAPFTFHKKLPGEVKDFLQGRAHLKRMFTVTDDAGKASGDDAMRELGDRYWQIADSRGSAHIHAALNHAHRSQDPHLNLLAAIHDTMPPKGEKLPVEAVEPGGLELDDAGTINGFPVKVTENEDGEKMLVDHGNLPDTPVDAIAGPIPFDKGSRHKEEPAEVGDDPFGGFAPEADEPSANPAQTENEPAAELVKPGPDLHEQIKQHLQKKPNASMRDIGDAVGEKAPGYGEDPTKNKLAQALTKLRDDGHIEHVNPNGFGDPKFRAKESPAEYKPGVLTQGHESLAGQPDAAPKLEPLPKRDKPAAAAAVPLGDRLERIKSLRTGGLSFEEAKSHVASEQEAGKQLPLPADQRTRVLSRAGMSVKDAASHLKREQAAGSELPIKPDAGDAGDTNEAWDRRTAERENAKAAAATPLADPPSTMTNDLFGKPRIDSSGIGQQGGMFHEPVDVKRPEGERLNASANAVDPKNTAPLPFEKPAAPAAPSEVDPKVARRKEGEKAFGDMWTAGEKARELDEYRRRNGAYDPETNRKIKEAKDEAAKHKANYQAIQKELGEKHEVGTGEWINTKTGEVTPAPDAAAPPPTGQAARAAPADTTDAGRIAKAQDDKRAATDAESLARSKGDQKGQAEARRQRDEASAREKGADAPQPSMMDLLKQRIAARAAEKQQAEASGGQKEPALATVHRQRHDRLKAEGKAYRAELAAEEYHKVMEKFGRTPGEGAPPKPEARAQRSMDEILKDNTPGAGINPAEAPDLTDEQVRESKRQGALRRATAKMGERMPGESASRDTRPLNVSPETKEWEKEQAAANERRAASEPPAPRDEPAERMNALREKILATKGPVLGAGPFKRALKAERARREAATQKPSEDPAADVWRQQASKMTTPKLKASLQSSDAWAGESPNPISELQQSVLREELERRGVRVNRGERETPAERQQFSAEAPRMTLASLLARLRGRRVA